MKNNQTNESEIHKSGTVADNSGVKSMNILQNIFGKKSSKFFKIFVLILLIAVINIFIINLITNFKAKEQLDAIQSVRYDLVSNNDSFKTSKFYYVDVFVPANENFSRIREKRKKIVYDEELFSYLSVFQATIQEMNQLGVDNIQEATCKNHKILDKNKEIYQSIGIIPVERQCKYVFEPDWTTIYNTYSNLVSPEYRQWLEYLANEYKVPKSRVDSAESIKENILYLENFLIQNKQFAAKNDVLAESSKLLNKYVQYGDTNVFDSNKNINKEYKKSYEKFLTENSDSIYFTLIKDYYILLKENSFKYTPKVKEWLDNKIERVYVDIPIGEGLNVK
ncbi:hypothetical protein J6I39_08570 [bacterium]|nr:hypothetical protein [bacterium]